MRQSTVCCSVMLTGLSQTLGVSSTSMSGVRLWAEEILRIEWRCSSVRRVVCEVVVIKENSCSHRYVLPHREVSSLGGSWGIVSGINVETLQRPQAHMLPSACHCIGAQSAPFRGLMVHFPLQLQIDYWAVQTCFVGLQNRQIAEWMSLKCRVVCFSSVFRRACFPNEPLILVVIHYEELYNSKSKTRLQRTVLSSAFLPRRFWSGCAFKSGVWCDRARMLYSFITATLSPHRRHTAFPFTSANMYCASPTCLENSCFQIPPFI